VLLILEAVAREDADDATKPLRRAGARALTKARDRRGARGLAEDAFVRGDVAIRGDDLLVTHGLDRAAGLIARGDCTLPRGGVADPDRCRDGVRVRHLASEDDRRGALGLETEHLRPRTSHALRRRFDEPAPVGGDVPGVADRDEERLRRVAERFADLERGGLLTVDAVRVHAVHERDLAARAKLADD